MRHGAAPERGDGGAAEGRADPAGRAALQGKAMAAARRAGLGHAAAPCRNHAYS